MLRTINPTTFEFDLAGDAVKVGGSRLNLFEPRFSMTRWKEAELNIFLPESLASKGNLVTSDKDKIRWESDDIKLEFFQLPRKPRAYEYGAFELNYILKKYPLTNKVVLGIDMKGLVAYHQPPQGVDGLATRYKDACGRWVSQAVNVNGSYAFYYADRTAMGDSLHKAGKGWHWFKPELIDAIGRRCWADLHIEKDLVTITIPQEFLDIAQYPIQHVAGATIGKTDIGSGWTSWSDEIDCFVHTCGTTGTYTHAYMLLSSNGGRGECGIYDSTPSSLLGTSGDKAINTLDNIDINGDAWYKFPYASAISLTATQDYWLAFIFDDSIGDFAIDTEDAGDSKWKGQAYGSLPVTISGLTDGNQVASFYSETGEPPVGWTGKIMGVTNPAKINGIAVANISKVNGI